MQLSDKQLKTYFAMSFAKSHLEKDLADPKCLQVKIGWYCDKSEFYHVGIVLELDGKDRIDEKTKEEIP